jgi:hypothetical protein
VDLLLLKGFLAIESQGGYENRFLFASPTGSATVWQFINSMQHIPRGTAARYLYAN